MKIYKRIITSILALTLTLGCISIIPVSATSKTELSDSNTCNDNSNDVVLEELTTDSAVEISKPQTNTTETTGLKNNSTIKKRPAKTFTLNGWTFSIYDTSTPHNVEIIETTNLVGNVVIPQSIEYDGITYKVTRLGYGLFVNSPDLLSVNIPKYVNYIDDYAFDTCTSLTNITIPDGVTYIGDFAFANCSSLSEIVIPDSVSSIGSWAFAYCSSLSKITLPTGITSISDYTFVECSSLSEIIIPNGVTSIGFAAFDTCSSLSEITIPNSITFIGDKAFSSCKLLSEIILPAGLTSIEGYTFEYCESLTSITIPDGVTSIGAVAFSNCSSLSEVILPNTLTNIDVCAFSECSSLSEIIIPDSVTFIGGKAFEYCSSLSKIILPSNLTLISYGTFINCTSLSEIIIPNSVTYIGSHAFSGCTSLSEITLPDSVTFIDRAAFWDCTSLSEITLPDSVTFIDDSAFLSCTSLTEINLPVGLTTLGYEAFSDTSILYLDIPTTVTNLNPSFFCSIYNIKITPEFNNPNRAHNADTTSEVYVVSTESTSPLDGEVLPLKNIHLNAEKGLSVYIKYEITPDIDLDGGQMDGRKTFPAWSTAENLSEYLSTPTKTGYIFDSWEVVEAKTVNKNGLDYLVGPAESSQQLKLKAVWKSTIMSKNRYVKILFLILIMLYLLKLYLSKRNTNK